MKTRALIIIVGLLRVMAAPGESVMQSVHNLSASGPGTVKASAGSDACMFCHTSHKAPARTALWNHTASSATYTPYTSTTLKAVVGQPSGSSKLCLSCHDGTVALGSVNSSASAIKMKNGITAMPKGSFNLGTDLSSDHPISFVYDQNLVSADSQLKNPAMLTGSVKLDQNKQMQCTTCHDPHDNRYGNFLVQDNSASALCLNCHTLQSWSGSAHSISPATWNGQGKSPWTDKQKNTVAANACENCHASHNANTKQRLLTGASVEETCYACHSGSVAAKNVRREFNKFSAHPVEVSGRIHDAAEDAVNGPRHTSCADCHNPHSTQLTTTGNSKTSTRSLLSVKGMNAAGAVVNSVSQEYELCFRCHSDSPNKEASLVGRQFPQTNKRLQFAPANASFHPVETVGKNPTVPSLLPPYTAASTIRCTDCHNNDQGPAAGGTGANGPHGSAYAPLLERQQILTDFGPESSASYALCYKCHSRASILANQSFPGHANHVVKYQAACTTCHDSHGVVSAPGLINFNTTYVTPAANHRLSYLNTGLNRGNCTLTCHGYVHNNLGYNGAALLGKQFTRRK